MNKWHSITTKADIEELMDTYAGFHDSWLVSVNYQSGLLPNSKGKIPWIDDDVRKASLVFQRTREWQPSGIELEFSGVEQFQIFKMEDWWFECNIYFAKLYGEQQCIIWADCEECEEIAVDDLPNTHFNYIVARNLRWRIVPAQFRD